MLDHKLKVDKRKINISAFCETGTNNNIIINVYPKALRFNSTSKYQLCTSLNTNNTVLEQAMDCIQYKKKLRLKNKY